MYEASVIISFYNELERLKLVLTSIENQTFQNFEVIIADDGSDKSVVAKLKKTIGRSPLKIRHIWHEDKGFRKTVILNRAVMESDSDYLMFIDGDCILHSRFVEEHVKNKKNRTVLAGKRVNLTRNISNNLTLKKVQNRNLEKYYFFYFVVAFFTPFREKRRKHLKNGIYIKNYLFRKIANKKKKDILGSNFSLHKKDLMTINGFDERYKHPSTGEDSDICMRLKNNGINIQTIKHIAVQYHLYHRVMERNQANTLIYNDNKENHRVYTPYGIFKDSEL